jgi:hypothetical protein
MLFKTPYQDIEIYKHLTLKMDGIPIKRTKTFNMLGLTLNETISWNDHTDKIAKKVGAAIGVLYRLRHTLPKKALMTIYNSLILSHLHYCNILWGSTPGKLFLLQQKALRAVTFSDISTHCNQICKKISTLLLMDIHRQKIYNIYKLLNDGLLPPRIRTLLHSSAHGGYSNAESRNITPTQMKNIKFEIPYTLKVNANPEILAYLEGADTRNIKYTYTKKRIKEMMIDTYPARCSLLECRTCRIIIEDISLPTKASKDRRNNNRKNDKKKKKKTCRPNCNCIDCQAHRIKTKVGIFTTAQAILIPIRAHERHCPLECYCPLCADRTEARIAHETHVDTTPSTRTLIPRINEAPCPTECYCENCANTTVARLTRERQVAARRIRNAWLYT